ncbi:MerR family transcriptional regulator [Microlunatus soli]|uniref:DNA-binding transcriptional regulator, MerR family n=1 Tax=Microlunatus soli TaxID=630515 RepID=A0A1H1ZV23_9ACTN|nr:MerR family transcriptional regulator [Microlunatus soli]SDT37232.1 DNA-binding transcriptional regulator, MerR family [Microlunatus soli]
MAWSTRDVAELAGTTIKTVRHYHKIGLLNEPDRNRKGYKQYRVGHLLRLLRIRRLSALGVPLSQIAELQDDEHPEESLRRLDDELAAHIDRLQHARSELRAMLRDRLPTDLPAELGSVVGELGPADRALLAVYSRILDQEGIAAYQRMLIDYGGHPTSIEFNELSADADEKTRADLARRSVPAVLQMYREHPDVVMALQRTSGGPAHAAETVRYAMIDVYNRAQLDVLERVRGELSRVAT